MIHEAQLLAIRNKSEARPRDDWYCSLGVLNLCVDRAGLPITTAAIPSAIPIHVLTVDFPDRLSHV